METQIFLPVRFGPAGTVTDEKKHSDGKIYKLKEQHRTYLE